MIEFQYILPEQVEAFIAAGWEIVGPAKTWGGTWSLLARREVTA
jgi:hypothetical protein